MKRGEILYSPKFEFFDGWKDDKLLIALNNPVQNQPYLVVLVNSQQKNKYDKPGCYAADGYYFVVANADWFIKNTWVQFYDLFEFDYRKVALEESKGNLISKGILKEETIRAIINCIKISYSISRYHKELLT